MSQVTDAYTDLEKDEVNIGNPRKAVEDKTGSELEEDEKKGPKRG